MLLRCIQRAEIENLAAACTMDICRNCKAMDHMTAPCPTLVKWSEEALDLEEEVQDGVWVLDWSAELSDGEEVSNPLPPQWDDTDGTAGGR